MKTSWSDTQKIEAYLLENDPEEKLLVEANLILQPGLADTLNWQKQAYVFVREYSRRQLRKEIGAVHQKLFTNAEHSGFRKKIQALFRGK